MEGDHVITHSIEPENTHVEYQGAMLYYFTHGGSATVNVSYENMNK